MFVEAEQTIIVIAEEDAAGQLEALVERTIAGEQVIITRNGRPAVELVAKPAAADRTPRVPVDDKPSCAPSQT